MSFKMTSQLLTSEGILCTFYKSCRLSLCKGLINDTAHIFLSLFFPSIIQKYPFQNLVVEIGLRWLPKLGRASLQVPIKTGLSSMSWPDQNSSWDVQDNPRRKVNNFLKTSWQSIHLDFLIIWLLCFWAKNYLDGSVNMKKILIISKSEKALFKFCEYIFDSIQYCTQSKGLIKVIMAIWDCLSCCDYFWSGLWLFISICMTIVTPALYIVGQ